MKWLDTAIMHLRDYLSIFRPLPKKKREYSLGGWKRGSDGIYRNGEELIFRRGKVWARTEISGDMEGQALYPTLHAAIKGESKPEMPLLDAQFVNVRQLSPEEIANICPVIMHTTVDGEPCDGNGSITVSQ